MVAVLVRHALQDGVLHVALPRELDVTCRAAAALQIEALVAAYRPGRVEVRLASATPSAASLSALARLRRMCDGLGIPVVAVAPYDAGGSVPGDPGDERLRRPTTAA